MLEVPSTLADRVRQVLTENPDLDQSGLGRLMGVSKGAVSQWLDGQIKSMRFDYAVRLWESRGYSPMWLILGKGPVRTEKIEEALPPSTPAQWPFQALLDRFVALTVAQQHYIADMVERTIELFEENNTPPSKRRKRPEVERQLVAARQPRRAA